MRRGDFHMLNTLKYSVSTPLFARKTTDSTSNKQSQTSFQDQYHKKSSMPSVAHYAGIVASFRGNDKVDEYEEKLKSKEPQGKLGALYGLRGVVNDLTEGERLRALKCFESQLNNDDPQFKVAALNGLKELSAKITDKDLLSKAFDCFESQLSSRNYQVNIRALQGLKELSAKITDKDLLSKAFGRFYEYKDGHFYEYQGPINPEIKLTCAEGMKCINERGIIDTGKYEEKKKKEMNERLDALEKEEADKFWNYPDLVIPQAPRMGWDRTTEDEDKSI